MHTQTVTGRDSDINPLTVQPIEFTGGKGHTACDGIFVYVDSTFETNPEIFTVSLVSAARTPDPEHVRLINASAQVHINDSDG